MVDVAEYWIGKGVDYEALWRSYEEGQGYIEKYRSMTTHLLVIEFETEAKSNPLFAHEAVFKTIKGYFHDFKKACLSSSDYERVGPLFFYSVERGSGIYKFLGELSQLLVFGTTLGYEKAMGQHLQNLDKRLAFLKKHFGARNVDEEAFRAFMKARTPKELDDALDKLFGCGIKGVKVSKEPFRGRIKETERTLIELKPDG
jgi:hypothetical protein